MLPQQKKMRLKKKTKEKHREKNWNKGIDEKAEATAATSLLWSYMLKRGKNKDLEFLCIEMKSSWTSVVAEEERLYHFRLAKAILASFAFSCLCLSFCCCCCCRHRRRRLHHHRRRRCRCRRCLIIEKKIMPSQCVLRNGNANANIFARFDVIPSDVKQKKGNCSERMSVCSLTHIHTKYANDEVSSYRRKEKERKKR